MKRRKHECVFNYAHEDESPVKRSFLDSDDSGVRYTALYVRYQLDALIIFQRRGRTGRSMDRSSTLNDQPLTFLLWQLRPVLIVQKVKPSRGKKSRALRKRPCTREDALCKCASLKARGQCRNWLDCCNKLVYRVYGSRSWHRFVSVCPLPISPAKCVCSRSHVGNANPSLIPL